MGASIAAAIVTGAFTAGVALIAFVSAFLNRRSERKDAARERFRDERLRAALEYMTALRMLAFKGLPPPPGTPVEALQRQMQYMHDVYGAGTKVYILFPQTVRRYIQPLNAMALDRAAGKEVDNALEAHEEANFMQAVSEVLGIETS